MKSQFLGKIYYYILCGMFGGLISSFGFQILTKRYFSQALMSRPVDKNLLLLAILGAFIGGSLTLFPTFLEGRNRSSYKIAFFDGMKGLFIGIVFGAVAFPLAEKFHIALKKYFETSIGDIFSRIVALAVLGVIIGAGIGLALSITSGAKRRHALLGGLTGGAISGLIVEITLSVLKNSQMLSSSNIQLVSIITFLIIGMVILFFIAFFIISLSNAYLVGLKGSKFSGYVFPLSKFIYPQVAIIGSDPKSFIRVSDADFQHASISLTKKDAILKNLAKSGETLVNEIPVKEEQHLLGNEIITIGHARFQYVKNSVLRSVKKDASTRKIKILN